MKYAVKQAGILVRKIFDSEADALAWARRNYRGTDWEVVKAPTVNAEDHQ